MKVGLFCVVTLVASFAQAQENLKGKVFGANTKIKFTSKIELLADKKFEVYFKNGKAVSFFDSGCLVKYNPPQRPKDQFGGSTKLILGPDKEARTFRAEIYGKEYGRSGDDVRRIIADAKDGGTIEIRCFYNTTPENVKDALRGNIQMHAPAENEEQEYKEEREVRVNSSTGVS